MRNFDPMYYFENLYHEQKRIYEFNAKSFEDWEYWRKNLREKLLELLGLPLEKVPLEGEVVEKKEFEDYIREKVIFNSTKNLSVIGYLLIPKNISKPLPAVIALHGHGYGKDDIVGIWEDGTERHVVDGYQKDFGISLVKKGFVTFAIEQLGFGERRELEAIKIGKHKSSCRKLAFWALLLGKTLLGFRVWDVMRSIDYLGTREEVRRDAIGIMGISGGATTALFSSALDDRIKAVVISGYLNTFKDSILSISHCECNYVPNILKYAEMYDVASLIAPRPFLVEHGTKDDIFPISSTIYAIEKVREVYKFLKAEEKFDTDIFEGRHEISGRKSFDFLKRELFSI
ncbi:MAG: acetylxylan esterase [Dictyoglomus sp. NZ13-RE01]|nr:MAG: acetylxylan esterase [Dictyoglomus sp. NZ13-RE01]